MTAPLALIHSVPPSGRHLSPIRAERVLDRDMHLVMLDLGPDVLGSLLRDALRVLATDSHLRARFVAECVGASARRMEELGFYDVTNRLARVMTYTNGGSQVVLDTAQADDLRDQIENALIEPEACRARGCLNLADADYCAEHQDVLP